MKSRESQYLGNVGSDPDVKYLSLVALFVTFHWLSTVELVTATNQTGLI